MRVFALRGLSLALLALGACAAPASEGAAATDDELLLGQRFVDEQSVRRAALERSLAVRDNGYAALRLERYATQGGWDELPLHDPEVRVVGRDDEPFEPVWKGEAPETREAWLALGARAFARYPAQREPRLRQLITRPSLLAQLGLVRDASGQIGGLVLARYRDGSQQPALTCASCHARVDADGGLVIGPASDFDWGALASENGESAWGPGRVDVTSDGVDNPTSIPDLRAVRHQARLHWSGNLHNGLLELAARIETLLVTSSAETVRPPRELAFALALYVRSLGGDGETEGRGDDAVFRERCARCHQDATGAGGLIAADVVGTDPAATLSPERGTGSYRAPSLYRVRERTRLTHEGRFASLPELLDPARVDRGVVHPFGLELDEAERARLLAYLDTL